MRNWKEERNGKKQPEFLMNNHHQAPSSVLVIASHLGEHKVMTHARLLKFSRRYTRRARSCELWFCPRDLDWPKRVSSLISTYAINRFVIHHFCTSDGFRLFIRGEEWAPTPITCYAHWRNDKWLRNLRLTKGSEKRKILCKYFPYKSSEAPSFYVCTIFPAEWKANFCFWFV